MAAWLSGASWMRTFQPGHDQPYLPESVKSGGWQILLGQAGKCDCSLVVWGRACLSWPRSRLPGPIPLPSTNY